MNNRLLLAHGAGAEDGFLEEDVDVLNLHTYDEFDMVIFGLSLLTFACLFFCVGWCFHKICVYNKVAGNTGKDVETLSTKLSLTQRGKNAVDFFRGLSIRQTFSMRKRPKGIKSPRRMKNRVKRRGQRSSTIEEANKKGKHHEKKKSSATLKLPAPTTMATLPSQEEVDMSEIEVEEMLNILDQSFANSPVMPISNLADVNLDITAKRASTLRSGTMRGSMLMTPGGLGTPGLPSPGSNIQSQTHISMQIPMEYSENPYKNAAATEIIPEANEIGNEIGNEINKRKSGEVVIVYDESNIDATTPLCTPSEKYDY